VLTRRMPAISSFYNGRPLLALIPTAFSPVSVLKRSTYEDRIVEKQKLESVFHITRLYLATNGFGLCAADPCRGELTSLGRYYQADRQRISECRKLGHGC